MTWLLGVCVLAAVRAQTVVAPDDLFLDATSVAGVRWYAGLLSSLGVLGWTVAVSGCAATAYVARLGGRTGAARTFGTAVPLFSVHLLDDLFAFHADLLPRATGVPKVVWVAVLVGASGLWFVASSREVLRTRWGLLIAAGTGLASSVVIDALVGSGGRWYLLAEDGPKFLGVLALAAWAVTSAADVIRSVIDERSAPVADLSPARAPSITR